MKIFRNKKLKIDKSKNISLLILKILILKIICLSPFSRNYLLFSENKSLVQVDYIKQKREGDFYILGPGDKFSLQIIANDFLLKKNKDLNVFELIIDGSGYVNLPRLKRVYVAGLTIDELTQTLNEEYSKYLIKPNVAIGIIRYRPIKVYVDGEVEYPGLQVLDGLSLTKDYDTFIKRNKNDIVPGNFYFPTVIDVLRSAEGLSLNADLSNIEIIRKNSLSNGGGNIKTTVNLSQVLNLKDQSQNIRVLDGDMILVKRSEEPVFSQISKIIKTNINPRYISVFLGGRVESPGTYKINTTSSLTDALLIGGGSKTLKGKVVFLRYNNDGTIDRRRFRLNNSARKGSYKNPFMKNGDIVFLEKGLLNKTSDVIGEITSPLRGIVSGLAFYKILTD